MDQLLGDNLTLAVAIGAGTAVLLVIVLMVVIFGKKKDGKAAPPAKPKPPATVTERSSQSSTPVTSPAASMVTGERVLVPVTKPAITEIVPDLSDASKEVWSHPSGRRGAWTLKDGELRLGQLQAVRSNAHLKAQPGKNYRVDFIARAVSEPSDGGNNNFFVGPMFLDARESVVGWYSEQPPISIEEGPRAGSVEFVAPPTAASVHVSLHSNFSKIGRHGDGVIAFSGLRLTEMQASA